MISLGSRGVTEDVELPKELTPITSHSIAFVRLLCAVSAATQSGKYLLSSSGLSHQAVDAVKAV